MSITTTTSTPVEIRGPGPIEQFLTIPVTIASGADLDEGTILGKITASGKYAAYADGNANGTEVAVGILAREALAASADVNGVMDVRGNYVEASLTGLDANAKTDLGTRSVGSYLLL